MAVYHVATTGRDENSGTESEPFRTLGRAAQALAAGDECLVREGVYRETLRPLRSGLPTQPITYKPYPGEQVTLAGTERVTGSWERVEGDIYRCSVVLDLADGNQVFADRQMLNEARWPHNQGTLMEPTFATAGTGTTREEIRDPNLPDCDWTGATIWCNGSARWTAWTAVVSEYAPGLVRFETTSPDQYNDASEGAIYYLSGKRELLGEGEWFYAPEESMLYLWAPKGSHPKALQVEVKQRLYAIDLRGRTHIHVEGFGIFGATATTQDATGCKLDRLDMRYISHWRDCVGGYDSQNDNTGVILAGEDNELCNSEIAYSSGNGVLVQGARNRLVNCYIHDVDYSGTYGSALRIDGVDQLVSHNTACRAGRNIVLGAARRSCLQYNDWSQCGMICHDVGMLHFFHADGAGTSIDHNWVHDNHSDTLGAGIYLDNACQNYVVHHNVVYNVSWSPLVLNLPSNYNLVYNNTFYAPESKDGLHGSWGWTWPNDMLGVRICNNIFTAPLSLCQEAVLSHNLYCDQQPELVAPEQHNFVPQAGSPCVGQGLHIPGITDDYVGSRPDIGAYELAGERWRAGHDFDNPPQPAFEPVQTPYMNQLTNATFATKDLAPWLRTGNRQAKLTQAGPSSYQNDQDCVRTGATSVRLGPGKDGIEQTAFGLEPDTAYMAVAWIFCEQGAHVDLGISEYGSAERSVGYRHTRGRWVRIVNLFKTGTDGTSARISVSTPADCKAFVYVDDLALTLNQLQQEVYC